VSREVPPRIEWGPDGAHVLVCQGGAIRIRRPGGAVVRELAQRQVRLGTAPRGDDAPGALVPAGYLDARWLGDGRIIAIDVFGVPVQFTMQGALYGEPVLSPNPWRCDHAVLAAGGSAFAMLERGEVEVCSTAPRAPRLWALHHERRVYGLTRHMDITSVALAADGRLLAMGYQTATSRGWLVFDLTPQERPERLMDTWRAPIASREEIELEPALAPVPAPLAFAFDRTRRRLAVVMPERAPGIGVIRLGAPGPALRKHQGGARCVALDAHGVRAAYAYPAGTGEARLRVDYLAPAAKGPRTVELLETLWIDPGVGELHALAFDPEGHRIACLGEDGALEIAPVP
jgi:hypothetical protein